jgi:hypothetical protein
VNEWRTDEEAYEDGTLYYSIAYKRGELPQVRSYEEWRPLIDLGLAGVIGKEPEFVLKEGQVVRIQAPKTGSQES